MFRQRVILPVLCAAVCVAGAIRCGAVDDGFEGPETRGKASDNEGQSNTQVFADFKDKIQECKERIEEARASESYVFELAKVKNCLTEAADRDVVGKTIKERLAASRDDFEEIYEPEVIAQIVPTDEQALAQIDRVKTVTQKACDEAYDAGTKKAQCDALAAGFGVYVMSSWIVQPDNYVEWRQWLAQAMPESSHTSINDCDAERKALLKENDSQMGMNMAESAFGDCLQAANDKRIVGAVSNAKLGRVQKSFKALRLVANQLCGLMVNISDSPTGSISSLYHLGCISDTEQYIASSLDLLIDG